MRRALLLIVTVAALLGALALSVQLLSRSLALASGETLSQDVCSTVFRAAATISFSS